MESETDFYDFMIKLKDSTVFKIKILKQYKHKLSQETVRDLQIQIGTIDKLIQYHLNGDIEKEVKHFSRVFKKHLKILEKVETIILET